MIEVSSAQKEVVIPIPVFLSGYFPMREASGIHDPIYSHVLVWRNKKDIYILVSLDLVAIDYVFINAFKRELEEKYPDYSFNIIASVTHTHSSMGGTVDTGLPHIKAVSSVFGMLDSRVIDALVEASMEAAVSAIDTLSPGSMSIALARDYSIGTDRNDIDNYFDTRFLKLKFKNEDATTILINNACHPTVLDRNNTLISSDFIGPLYEKFDSVLLWTQGTSGNISTRFTRAESSFEQITRYADSIATQIEIMKSNYKPLTYIKYATYHTTLKTKEINIEELLEVKASLENSEDPVVQAQLMGVKLQLNIAEVLDTMKEIELEYSIFELNQIKFVIVPVELTSELGRDIIDENTFIISMANGYNFYVAETQNYDEGRYESSSSFLAYGEAEKWMKEIKEKLK